DITIKSNQYMLYSELVYNIVNSRIEMNINNDSDKKQLEVALYLSEQSKKYNITILLRDLMKLL
ncbi:transcriptional regulator, partial [Mammaliicoccus vitulinus]